ncbi:extracellular solute-binding protein [Streptomyces flavofungini]|uniref:extracellular solute-binding protein n=1 Tax=Streptomyces flavofungini TaxID=68200 RepID=UPI0025B2734B|nr:extracellular solute-binding protein [Streptomyces flavofungini]WJV51381.1 extracellular solute-binding protein [Streptomyces flavofungini]
MTALLAGCGGDSGDSGDVTLKLVAADYGDSAANSSKKYWGELTKKFEAEHPGIKVDVTVHSWTDVDREVKQMVKDGNAPDLAQIGAYADYAAQNKLYSADDLLSIPTQADFLAPLAKAGEVNRVQYGMPFAASTRLLFFNEKLFKSAGIKPPQSWTQLQAAAQKLKARGVKIPYALPLGPEEAQAETMQWLLSGGGGYTDNVDSYDIDSKQNVQTFDWLKNELVGKGLTGPTPPGKLNRAEAFAAFTRGDVGMLNGHPTLMQMASKKGLKYGMVPMPGVNGKAQSTMGVADWMMAFKQNGHRKEIGEFLNFVYSTKNVLDFSREYDLLPVTTSASQEMSDNKEDSAKLGQFLEELPASQLYPVGKTSWAQVSVQIKKYIGRTVEENGDPETILGQIESKAAAEESAR